MADDIISILFEKKTDSDMFDFKSDKLTYLENEKEEIERKLSDFIERRVHPNSKELLKTLIENYISITLDSFIYENKLYYRQGFLDGLSINMTSNK